MSGPEKSLALDDEYELSWLDVDEPPSPGARDDEYDLDWLPAALKLAIVCDEDLLATIVDPK